VSENQNNSDQTRLAIALSEGTLISHYAIVSKIGAGGMGEVYLAHDTELDRKVALKFLSAHLYQDPSCRARFKREAQAAAKLDHPSIVRVYEVGEYQGRPYFVMEYIDGQTLLEYSKSCLRNPSELLPLILAIANGLQTAHENGVIHRDIKPANILVTRDGQPKILDFGLARLSGVEDLTREHTVLGTLSYMSPEQVLGGNADHRSDIFSMGVVFYEVLSGMHPFKADYEAAIAHNIVNEVPRTPTGEVSSILALALPILDKAMQKDPNDRYQNVLAFATDIEQAFSGSTEKKPRHRRGIIVSSLSVVLLIAAIAILLIYWPSISGVGNAKKESRRILVVPFKYLGPPEQAYIASGISTELRSVLVTLNGVSVIPELTSERFRESKIDLREVEAKLGAQFILNGTVQFQPQTSLASGRVHVVTELIDVAKDAALWSAIYDTTAQELLAIRSDIVERVAGTIGVTPQEGVKVGMGRGDTRSREAFDCLLRGNEYAALDTKYLTDKNSKYAVEMYDRAIRIDSGYALAYAQKSKVLSARHRCEEAKATAVRSLALSPSLQEGNIALGLYYSECERNWTAAVHYWDIAYANDRNNVEYLDLTAQYFAHSGQWDMAYENYERAVKLEPESAHLQAYFGFICIELRKYDEAERAADKLLRDNPDLWTGYYLKASTCLFRNVDIECLRSVIETSAKLVRPEDQWWLYESRRDVYLLDEDYTAALREARDAPFDNGNWETGMLYFMMGKQELMRAQFDTATALLQRDGGARARGKLAVVLAGLGKRDEALRLGKEVLSQQLEDPSDLSLHWNLAVVYTMLGEKEAAVMELDSLLTIPGPYSVAFLRHDPTFKSLRDWPGFKKLLEKHAT
jgi:eukaryotic-like serine/threonine-protein kinase